MSFAPYGANCAVEIALPLAAILTLMLVCAFFSTQVQKYLAWDYNKDTLPGDCHSTAKRCFAMTLSTSYGKE